MKNRIRIAAMIILLSAGFSKTEAQISVGIGLNVRIAPPALPVYTQPACPVEGYLWMPGYWAYGSGGYYWVPGAWVAPPQPGLLWTPGYWGYEGALYVFHNGYWGHHVGFYGGVSYGYGYGGTGFVGGEWRGNAFRYNTAVVNVNRTVVHNTYINNTVIHNNTTINRASFNGPGGIHAQPRPEERVAMNERHFQPTAQQLSHERVAHNNRSQYVPANHGRPATSGGNNNMQHSQNRMQHNIAPQHAQMRPSMQQHSQPQRHPGGRPAGGNNEHHERRAR